MILTQVEPKMNPQVEPTELLRWSRINSSSGAQDDFNSGGAQDAAAHLRRLRQPHRLQVARGHPRAKDPGAGFWKICLPFLVGALCNLIEIL